MKEKLIQTIKSIYYKLGFFPPQRILSVEQIHQDYRYLPEEIKRFLIQDYIYKIASFNKIELYIDFLQFHFPDNQFSFQNSQFITQLKDGGGGSSFSSFRKIKSDNELWFEKVYFSDHPDLQRNIFFYNHIYPLLKEDLQIPKLQKLISGEWLSIAYFDFFNLQKIEEKKYLIQEMIVVSLILYQRSIKYQKTLIKICKSSIITDFILHPNYLRNKKIVENKLLKSNILIKEVERKINQSYKILTHGDINLTNIYQNRKVIDWDNFGIYPIGFEVASFYHRLVWKNEIENNFEEWLEKNYKNKIDSFHWKDFKRNSCYFLYVFLIRELEKPKHSFLKSILIKNISDNFLFKD